MDKMIICMVAFGIYVLFLMGVSLLFYKDIYEKMMKFKMRYRLSARRRDIEGPNKLISYVDHMTEIAFNRGMNGKKFIGLTIFIVAFISFVGMKNFPPIKALFIGLIMGTLPTLILKIKIETIRRKSSYEGERLMVNFLSEYRLSGFNIYETMESVVKNYKDIKVSNRLLFKLLLELRATGNPLQMEKACTVFSYAVNTNWGRMLAYNIGLAAESGMNVYNALEDILIQLREARTLVEERKRMNAEAVRMLIYLVPFLYIGTILISINIIGLSFQDFFVHQFFSSQGFILFLAIVFMLLINIGIIESINNQRFDY